MNDQLPPNDQRKARGRGIVNPPMARPPPISIQSTPGSRRSVFLFLLAFQRRLAESPGHQGVESAPPLFVEGLLEHCLEHSVRVVLDDTFHLRMGARPISTQTKSIMVFSVDQDRARSQWAECGGGTIVRSIIETERKVAPANATAGENGAEEGSGRLISFHAVRKWDSDLQVMDVRTGDARSRGGHYMSLSGDLNRSIDHQSILPGPAYRGGWRSATELLREHWFAPHRWWNCASVEGDEKDCLSMRRAQLVRPGLLAFGEANRYCPSARNALSDGYTLFVAMGLADLVTLRLPGRRGVEKLHVAGLMFQERAGSSSNSGLIFIIREGFRDSFELQGGMMAWDAQDEYKYFPGPWR